MNSSVSDSEIVAVVDPDLNRVRSEKSVFGCKRSFHHSGLRWNHSLAHSLESLPIGRRLDQQPRP